MRRPFMTLMLAGAFLAGCASQPLAQAPSAHAAASAPASAEAPTALPLIEAQVPALPAPSPAATPTQAPVITPVPAPATTPQATAKPKPTATPKPTPVAVSTKAPVITPVPEPTAPPVAAAGLPAGFVSASDAIGHVGQVAMVCGTVASANYAVTSAGSPTFLNLDKPYPNAVFTILIWQEHRASFGGTPERLFFGARVCITGLVSNYRGAAQIESSGGDIEVYD